MRCPRIIALKCPLVVMANVRSGWRDRHRSSRACGYVGNSDLGGELLSEAAARQAVGNGPCSSFTGHPEGVWLLRVWGQFEGRAMQLRLLLDAVTGEQLCGEESVAGQ